jgi:hypothetical protein
MSPKTRISSLTGTVSERLNAALKLPNGARFYPCVLQINPFGYLSRHGKHANFRNEVEYNAAIIGACQELEIEVIGVTDHYRVKDSAGVVQAARDAGLFVFSGFEGVAKDGVHLLCLFDADKDPVLERLAKQKRGGLENRSIEQRDCKCFEPLREPDTH